MHVAKTKALISFAGTAKLICTFVFAYAYCWFSHAAAQIILNPETSCAQQEVLNLRKVWNKHIYCLLPR